MGEHDPVAGVDDSDGLDFEVGRATPDGPPLTSAPMKKLFLLIALLGLLGLAAKQLSSA